MTKQDDAGARKVPVRLLRTLAALVAMALLLVPLTSCKNPNASAATPPAPEPRPVRPSPPPPAGPVSEPQTVATLPTPQPVPPNAVPATPGPLVNQPEEENTHQPAPAPSRPQNNPQPTVAEAPPQPETPVASVPQLGQMISSEQRRAYSARIDDAIRRATERLEVATANASKLSEDQRTTIKRIRAFVKQAQDAREQDPVIANNLANRAATLADDLVKNFK